MQKERPVGLDEMVGESPLFEEVLRQAIKMAKNERTVLIMGERGTGKELMARAIHRVSARRRGSFVKVECSTATPALLDTKLFGTDVSQFEVAEQGTLLFKHIDDLSQDLQPKVLRLIEKREIERLEGAGTSRVDIKLIATTSDLGLVVDTSWLCRNLVASSDLSILRIAPLRERRSDIPLLAWHFTKKWGKLLNKSIDAILPAAMESLVNYRWPNNVRELEIVIGEAVRSSKNAELRLELPSSAA